MKLVILANPGPSTDVLVNFLEDAGLPPVAVLVEPPQSRQALLRGRVRRLGWGAVPGQVLFITLVLSLLRRRAGPRLETIRATHGLRNDPLPSGRVTPIASVNAPETFERLRLLTPDVVVFSGIRIVRPATQRATRALWTGRTQDFGATLHLVGRSRGRYRPGAAPCLAARRTRGQYVTYPLLQLAAALPILAEVLHRRRQRQELPNPVPVPRPRRQWHHPTLGQYLAGLWRGVW
jgi:hypothetical protein